MAITTSWSTSALQQLLEGGLDFQLTGGNAFMVALMQGTHTGTYGAATTNFSDISGDEASGTGYTTGGATLTRVDPASGSGEAWTDFADAQWTTATFDADGCIIYATDATPSNASISVHDFSGTKTVSGGNFDLQFPAAAAGTAVLRLT